MENYGDYIGRGLNYLMANKGGCAQAMRIRLKY